MHKYKRIKDLPVNERKPFSRFLNGQTRPMIDGVSDNEQDGYYDDDYIRWKKGLPVID